MATGTAERPSAAELKAKRAEREKNEAAKAAKSNGRADIDAAHAALGTSVEDGIDSGPQDVHDGDDEPVQSASGAPVQLGFSVGGKKPTGSQVRLVGGKIDVPGQYAKGQTAVFRITVKFGEIAFVDLEDKETGQVVGCDRRQKGRITAVSEL